MLTLLSWEADGPFVRYSFGTGDPDERAWEYSVREGPVTVMYAEALLPLAREQGEELTVEQVIRCVVESADGKLVHPTTIDWLGLALHAERCFREKMANWQPGDPPDLGAERFAAHKLARHLEAIYDRFADALYAKVLQPTRSGAA
jgi:hypothetical protein